MTSYRPATRAGARNTTSVVLERTTVAAPDEPTSTRAPAGSARPVTRTSVPPATGTRTGLIEVMRKVPVPG